MSETPTRWRVFLSASSAHPGLLCRAVRGFIRRRAGRVAVGRLDGRVALVTGGSGGIGRAAVLELAREGADVGVQYNRGKEAADSAVGAVRKLGPRSVAVQADVADARSAERVVAEVVRTFGRLDVVACFAGYPIRTEEWYKDYAALTPDEVRAPIDIDLLGSIFVTQAALPAMVRARRGSIILVGSTPALTGDTVGIPYLVAKGGVLALARALAQVYGPHGVRINALALGSIASEATKRATKPADRKRWLKNRPCGAGARLKKSLASSCSSRRTTLRTSPGRRSSSTADTRCASHSLRRWKGHAFHQKGPPRSAGVTREDEGSASDRKLLADDPVTSSANAHESDLFQLPAGAEEQAVLGASPTLDDNPLCRVDADLADRRHRRRQRSRALRPFARRRVCDPASMDSRERSKSVILRLAGREDMNHAQPTHDESVRKQRAMALPRDRLRAHDGGPPFLGDGNQPVQSDGETGRGD